MSSYDVFTFTPVLEAAILADNDVFFVPIEVPGVFYKGLPRKLSSIVVIDGDDQTVDFDLVFFNADATLGTLNSGVTISDADAEKIIGYVRMTASTDSNDLINSYVYAKSGVGLVMKGVTASVWVGGIIRSGTPDYTASGMKIKLGFE
jgi:hypothetical protein